MDIAKTYDVFSKTEFDRIRLMTSQLLKIRAAEKAGNINDPDFIEKAGPLLGFYFGIGGSALGTKTYNTLLGGGGGPGSIKAASIGANAVTDFLLKIPQVKNLEKISTIFLDPKFLTLRVRVFLFLFQKLERLSPQRAMQSAKDFYSNKDN
jgi:hypothetical protein